MWRFLQVKWHRLRHFLLENIIGVHDTPHRIALGVAVGLFVAFTPTIPFQMVLTAGLAFLLGANKVVGLPVVWITNPVTAVPVYYAQFMLGEKLLRQDYPTKLFLDLLIRSFERGAGQADRLAAVSELFSLFLWPLLLGSLLISLLTAAIGYAVTLRAVVRYQRLKKVMKHGLQNGQGQKKQ